MQEDFGMGEDHQQVFLLCQRKRFPLIQLFVVTGLPEEPLKLTPQIEPLPIVYPQRMHFASKTARTNFASNFIHRQF